MDNKILNGGGGGNKRNCQLTCLTHKFDMDLNSSNQSKIKAFTLAEVLITLAIIGIVAALTIPTVITNYQKKQYVTQLKKEYNYVTNGLKAMMARDGVTKLSDTSLWTKISGTQLKTEDILSNANKGAKEEFLKAFNVATIYNSSTIPDEFKIVYKGLNCQTAGNCAASPITSGIHMSDGAWLAITFNKTPSNATCGDHKCNSLRDFQESKNTPTKFWQYVGEVYIDVNGPKGPNTWGRDIFRFALDNNGTLYPYYGADMACFYMCSYAELGSCDTYWKGSTSRSSNCSTSAVSSGNGCAARIMEEGWEMTY